MCMSDCTHSIVSRCALSSLSPSISVSSLLFRFYLLLASTLHPALIYILSSTSCVSSAFFILGGGGERLSHSICDMSRNCCVCANVSEPWLDTNTAGHYGMSRVFTVLGRIKLHCKIAFCPLAITDSHSLRQSGLMHVTRHLFQSQTWLCGPVSPLRPSYPVSPVFPRGPCVPPRPHSTHTHTHMVLITKT